MKPEIKERVEKIRKGEVPEGYKETKVGVIPADWGVKELIKYANKISDGIHTTPEYVEDTKYFFINGNNLKKSKVIITDGTRCVDEKEYIKHRRELNENSILMSINGTIGECAFYQGEKVILGKSAAYINCKDDYDVPFIFYNLHTARSIYHFFSELTGSTIMNLSLKSLKETPIPSPEINERKQIAEILSTWDTAIELKEKLIEEKMEFKEGIMQNLIFAQMNDTSNWKFTKFKEIFKIIKRPIDKHPEKEYKRLTVKRRLGGVKLRDIKKGKEILVDSQHIVKEGDFIISNRQVFHGAIGVVQKKLENSIISMEYSILRCNEGFDTEFLFYCMYSSQFKKTVIKRTQGVHEEKFVFLFNEWYKTLGLHIPSIDEQKSTVSVLNNLNENIQILTNEVAQLKVQKKGLMQLLLTGIVRVEVD